MFGFHLLEVFSLVNNIDKILLKLQASEDEPFEEKDRFVAQLYKFMDDRGTPINKGPCIGNKDLNLYKLFKIVQNIGGYNKVGCFFVMLIGAFRVLPSVQVLSLLFFQDV